MHLKRIHIRADRFPVTDRYPFCLDVFRRTGEITLSTAVTFFQGENGTGKSTLLRAVCRSCGITIWRFQEGHRCEYNPYEERLSEAIDGEWEAGPVPGTFFAAQFFQDFALILDDWASSDPEMLEYFGGKSLLTQSHGQSFMSFFRSRFRLKGLYFLDEPETALSPRSQLALLRFLEEAGREGKAQFIVATHSPILLSLAGAEIYNFDSAPIHLTTYEETEHFRLFREFFQGR